MTLRNGAWTAFGRLPAVGAGETGHDGLTSVTFGGVLREWEVDGEMGRN